ncbi:AAA domain-containing protein [Streptomyces sp. 15-116A]|uniref:AAA domain-containing protein n=1 Tax=Streptomyces sp. 15-116A TaxID=2259035 RepID=UPI0021B2F8F8|nr:AAA domain-containing protein [Streptomyces sp. 15-116A]MCT7354271.1 AAA domain-containing protein [Streptomyces sp. 15-116A]
MRSEHRRRTDVVTYWRAVELFSPPQIKSPSRRGARVSEREWVQQVDVRPGQPWPTLPWEQGHPLQRERIDPRKEVWRHTVYGGVFPLERIREALAAHFGDDGEDFSGARRQQGETAVFALVVDADGRLLDKATSFSSCAWATGRIRDPGPGRPDWLDGFEETEAACSRAICMLTQHHIPYRAAPSAAPGLPGPVTTGGAPAPAARDWRGIVREILGGAAVGALGALIGDFGAGAVAGALRPVARRISRAVRGADGGGTSDPAPGSGGGSTSPEDTTDTDTDSDVDGDQPGRPLELPDLVAFAAHVADLCGVGDLLSPASIRIHSQRVRRRRDGSLPDPEPVFLNSLLPEDLERVADAEEHGAALTAYLTAPGAVRTAERVDVREHPGAVLDGVAPDATPLGRWPAPVGHPLALSQQFAVNRIVAELSGGSGLFSVNGPPGTGKTTMLRDLIAAIVVERAVQLASLSRPSDGFSGRVDWYADGVKRGVATPRPALTGHEIVVASSNNGAVQNITTELPALDALGEEWRAEASYFLDQAVSLLDGAPAWGAVAAPLGKAEKRRDFMERWWWGEKQKSGGGGTRSRAGNRRGGGDDERAAEGMQALLKRLEGGERLLDPPAEVRFPAPGNGSPSAPVPEGTAAVDGWSAAKAAFNRALRHAESLRAVRAAAARALRDLGRLDDEVEDAALADQLVRYDEEDATDEVEAAYRDLRHASVAYDEARGLAEQHRLSRPGGLRAALGTGRALAEWQERGDRIQAEVERAFLACGAARTRAREAERALDRVGDARRESRERLRLARLAASEARDAVERARTEFGEHVPENWERLGDDRRELSAPWSDAEFCTARTRVFLAALNLHRAFVVANAATLRRNLLLLKDLFAGLLPGDAALAVWQSLFLVMPVVSTTFASCGRLFGTLGGESLGWVLIDEAGQAAPQAAAGALWRARRAVLVGDPLQLEPVVPLPLSVQERLRRAYGVDAEWLPARTSAQRVADRTNRWGTTVPSRGPDGDEVPVWVGAPLRVHRRCERTMFDLSNDIAYDGLMVYGTEEKPFPGPELCADCMDAGRDGCRDCVYPLSCWVDVPPGDTAGKWVPEEGAALARILTVLHRQWRIGLDRVRVLSPFRDVVSGCARTVRDMRLGDDVPPGADPEAYRKQVSVFLSEHIGTVHTMQGKESDVVVLVLGTHPRDGARARAWAAEKPNLLNVAVSRAKRRLFVIGHRDSWCKEPHFDLLADPSRLPRRAWPAGRTV